MLKKMDMIKDFMWRLNLFHWFLTPNQHEAQEGETKSKAEMFVDVANNCRDFDLFSMSKIFE